MKKALLLLMLIAIPPAYLLGSGTISTSSLAMMLNVMTGKGIDSPDAQQLASRFQMPEGFSLSLYAGDLPNARFLHMTANRDLLVTRPHKGDVILIRASSSDPRQSAERETLLSGLTRPSGIDIADGWLYIGEANAVGRVKFDEATGRLDGDYQHIIEGLTFDGNHAYKGVGIGPDQKLYLVQGSTCNVCEEDDARRGTASRFNLDGSGEQLFATGLRNTMGFDLAPWNNALYGTDNGRDMLSDDYPPCELNLIEDQQFYGWPYFNGNNQPDPDFNQAPAHLTANPVAPVHEFRAHNAPLGMKFVDAQHWPDGFEKAALVALHGSWNRSIPDGYRVVSLHWQGDEIVRKDFLSGFEKGGDIIGRPVDITQGPDGAVFISDDYAGAIYRVAFEAPSEALASVTSQNTQQAFQPTQPDWLNETNRSELQAQGQQLYRRFGCISCHNPSVAKGNMQLQTLNQRLQYEQVIERLTNPRPPMPTFPLSEQDKQALAAWLMTPATEH